MKQFVFVFNFLEEAPHLWRKKVKKHLRAYSSKNGICMFNDLVVTYLTHQDNQHISAILAVLCIRAPR